VSDTGDVLVRLTCRNCGGDLKHIKEQGDRIDRVAQLRCTEPNCRADHLLRVRLSTLKDVA
jgi:hypothetical protein